MSSKITFDDAENPGKQVTMEADPQCAVTPGTQPGTAIIHTPDGQRSFVKGDYRDVQARLQAAAAQAHESGEAPRGNTPMS
jgi:hypothetical protein